MSEAEEKPGVGQGTLHFDSKGKIEVIPLEIKEAKPEPKKTGTLPTFTVHEKALKAKTLDGQNIGVIRPKEKTTAGMISNAMVEAGAENKMRDHMARFGDKGVTPSYEHPRFR